jgi:hypothetical protein
MCLFFGMEHSCHHDFESYIPGKLRGLGEQLVYGRIVKNVHIKIGSQTITWDVCTAPLRDDVILGLEFLEAHKAVIRTLSCLNPHFLYLNRWMCLFFGMEHSCHHDFESYIPGMVRENEI